MRQASTALKEGRATIVKGLAKSKADDGIGLLDKLDLGLMELEKIVKNRDRDAVVPKQKELLDYCGS